MNDVVVLGSLNMDIVVTSSRFPKVGETIMGKHLAYHLGGKGANQAVADSRMDILTCLLGKVGADVFGKQIIDQLATEKLCLEHVSVEAGEATDIATITKTPEDNSIIVIAGANSFTDVAFVTRKEAVISQAKVLLGQMEIPVEALKEAFKIAQANGVLTILNPAPYTNEVVELLSDVDYLTPNETEFQELVARFHESIDFEADLLELSKRLTAKIIVTRGKDGVSFVENNQVVTLPTLSVNVKDTTGAGDTFNGIFVTYLAKGYPLRKAVEFASVGASLSIEKDGAQGGMPTLKQLEATMLDKNAI